MATFYYRGGNQEGRTITGEIDADDENTAAVKVRRQGLFILSLRKSSQIGPFDLERIHERISGFLGSELKPIERILFTSHLASMLKTGVPLIEAIEAFEDKKGGSRSRKMFKTIVSDLESGRPLSYALARYPRTFSPIYTHIVSSGESMGTLDATLGYLGNQLKRDYEFTASVRGAMIYPAVVLSAMLAVLIFISVTVVPKLLTFAQNVGRELPISTRILIGITNTLLHYGVLIGIILVFFGLAFVKILRTKKGREIIDTLLLKIPIVGELLRGFNLARFSRLLGSFYHYGIPLPTAFTILASSLPNLYYEQEVLRFKEKMAHGLSLSASIDNEKGNLFPKIFVRVLRTAEKSGEVDQALTRLAEYYESELENTLKNMTTIIEPVLILILGLAVMGIALAVVVPIYQITTSLK